MPESAIVSVDPLVDLVAVRILVASLDEDQLRRLQTELRAAANAHPGMPIAVDFGRVDFLPSLSLAALIRIHSELRNRQRLMLVGLQPAVRDVFLITRLDRLFELHEDMTAAQKAVRPG